MNEMEERKKIDFKRHTLPPVSKKYLWRIIFYLVMLSVIGYIALSTLGMHKKQNPETIDQIHGVTIELE